MVQSPFGYNASCVLYGAIHTPPHREIGPSRLGICSLIRRDTGGAGTEAAESVYRCICNDYAVFY